MVLGVYEGIVNDGMCCFCGVGESIEHLFFRCAVTKRRREFLNWLQGLHTPEGWDMEENWISTKSRGKGWRVKLLKENAAETIHAIWTTQNNFLFQNRPIDGSGTGPGIVQGPDAYKFSVAVILAQVAQLR